MLDLRRQCGSIQILLALSDVKQREVCRRRLRIDVREDRHVLGESAEIVSASSETGSRSLIQRDKAYGCKPR